MKIELIKSEAGEHAPATYPITDGGKSQRKSCPTWISGLAADGYHLYSWSRAIDRRGDAGVKADIDGVYDLGADEIEAEFFTYLPLVVRNP